MKTSLVSRISVLALLLLLTSGCATGPVVNPQITAAVKEHHVAEGTYNKMLSGDDLDYDDIVNLVRKRVPTYITLGYLRSTEEVYHFSSAQLRHLRALGASSELTNYLTETEGFYGTYKNSYRHYVKGQRPRFFSANRPVTNDWHDSAYEESAFSPFSFH